MVSESGSFKFCIRVLSDLNLASISMFMFFDLDSRFGFTLSSCVDVGFGFSPNAHYMLFKHLAY